MSSTELPPQRRRLRLLAESEYEFVRAGFAELLPLDGGVEDHLRAVISDTLDHPGSLVRAQVAHGIMLEHGVAPERSRLVACAIEYFHTASLIFDDMPSMDDATERRGRTCPHLAYGEAAATLGALAFINRGYALLWEVIGRLEVVGRTRASRLVTECLGPTGILNGQARDIHFVDSAGDEDEILRVAAGKTVPLIRLTLQLPAIVGGADDPTLALLDRLSTAWGLSYQIMDDFKDRLMTREETGKSTSMDDVRNRPSLPGKTGPDHAMARLSELMSGARTTLGLFPGNGAKWGQLAKLQALLEEEQREIRTRVAVRACA